MYFLQRQFICLYDTNTAQKPGSQFSGFMQ